jgi:sucrose-6-phosphate hydrolase SacC (GH32 family)
MWFGAVRRLAGVSWMAALAATLAAAMAGCGALVSAPPTIHATYSTQVTTPRATPAATAPIYQNALTGGATLTGWSTNPVCDFTSGSLVVKPANGQAYICLAPTAPLGDVAVTVTLAQQSGAPTHAAGIAFRHSAAKSYYFFGVDEGGRYTLSVVTNDVSHTVIPFTANAAIHSGAGATNRLQILMQGQSVTLFVNGATVGEATLSTYASGTVGLRGVNDGQTQFTDLTIAAG